MIYDIPQVWELDITTIVLDLNGTLAVKWTVVVGVQERIDALKALGFSIILFTGDQRGNARLLCTELGIEYRYASSQEEKEQLFMELDIDRTAAIGNARIDNGTFRHAKLSIATLQAEGIHIGILPYVDIIVPSILDALDLFIDWNSLKATMRM